MFLFMVVSKLYLALYTCKLQGLLLSDRVCTFEDSISCLQWKTYDTLHTFMFTLCFVVVMEP